MFANLKTDDTIENEIDSVGGGGALESGIYKTVIDAAYTKKSKGGAMAVVLHLVTEDKRDIRQTLWVTSGDAKGNKNYYETKDGERKYLPGFNMFQSLCLLTVAKEAAEMSAEEKILKLYNPESKKEEPTTVPVLTELLGNEIYTGLIKQTVDKTQKNGEGNYVPTGETRDENEIDKFFRVKDKLTTAEIRGGSEEAVFFNTWSEKNTGVTRDKTSKVKGGTPGAPAAAPSTAAPTKSLFG